MLLQVLFSLVTATSVVNAAAPNVHHFHKRAPVVVTEYVHQTQYVYQDAHVYVDQNGNPYSTSYNLVSTGVPVSVVTSVAVPTPSVESKLTSTSTVFVTLQPAASTSAVPAVSSAAAASSSDVAAPAYVASSTAAVTSEPVVATTTTTPVVVSSARVASTTSVFVETSSTPVAAASSSTSEAAPAATSSTGSSGDFSGDATFFDVGLGACGWENSDTELVAALNKPQFESFGSQSNGNPACGKTATLSRNGKSVTVKIVDLCPECSFGSLDLSPAAFDALADESEGRVQITWSWAS